jgi:hypothetical protein
MGRFEAIGYYGFPVKPHLEQLARIKRWKSRIDDFRFSNSPDIEISNQLDFIYAFFINCYHLKDFLEYSKLVSDKVISKFVEKNIEMQICRYICFESKHCSITQAHSGITDSSTGEKVIHGLTGCIIIEGDPFQEILKYDNPIKNGKYSILVNGKNYDLFELADKCVKLWETFLEENNCFLSK